MSVTGRANDELPRLPPAPPTSGPPAGSARFRSDTGPSDRTGAIIRRMTWSEYVEPELLRLRLVGWIVIGTRVVLTLCAVGVVVAAMTVRTDSAARSVTTATLERLGLIGLAVAGIATVAGWLWTDRATRDVHRLDARLPARRRCVTAWAAPLVWAVGMSLTVLQLDPTAPVDVRPLVAAAVFAASLWRPYALVRRILKSLIRVDSDVVIASGYVLDVALFGLLWARLTSLPDTLGPADRGVVGGVVGLAAVAVVAATGSVAAWSMIIRDVDRAVAHRRVAVRTRHEHRQLRLAGIDPLDPKVRLALLMIRQAEHRGESPGADGRDAVGVVGPVVEHQDDLPPLRVEPLLAHAATPPPAATDGAATDGAATADDVRRETAGPDAVVPTEDATRRSLGRDPLDQIAARLRPNPASRRGGARSFDAGVERRSADRPTDRTTSSDRLGRALGRLGGEAGDDARSIPERLDRLSSRLSGDGPSDAGASILDRLQRFGITPSDGVVHDSRRPGADPLAEAPLMIPRVHALEAVRYLLVLAIVVCAGAAAWFVGQSVDVGQVADGAIVPTAQDRLELARLVAVRALAVALVLVPLWCAVAARWAGRVGLPVRGAPRCVLLAVAAAGIAGAGIVADPASDVLLVATLACLGAALWAVPVMIDIERRAGRGVAIPSLVPLALATAVGTAYVGRMLRPVEATHSLEAMSFVGGLLALVAAIAAVVTAVATGDAVEAIRLAPAASERERAIGADRDA